MFSVLFFLKLKVTPSPQAGKGSLRALNFFVSQKIRGDMRETVLKFRTLFHVAVRGDAVRANLLFSPEFDLITYIIIKYYLIVKQNLSNT